MEPGDVLLHDDMVIHGSPQVQGNALRRTIYFEFRSVEQILDEGPWDEEFVHKRQFLIPMAIKAHANRYPNADAFKWNPKESKLPQCNYSADELKRVTHIEHSPSSFCSATSETRKF